MPRIFPHPYIFVDGVSAVEQDVSAADARRLVHSGAFSLEPFPIYGEPPPEPAKPDKPTEPTHQVGSSDSKEV